MFALEGLGIDLRGPGRLTRLRFPDQTLAAGGLLLLRGASGSGKSTLISLLAGLKLATSGKAIVCGTDPAGLSTAARDIWRGRTLGLLPQRLHLSQALDVRENLLLPALAVGAEAARARRRADDLLSRLGIAELALARPADLSGGQAQRVALARALMNSPSLLIADEPTASLDDNAAAQVIDLLLNGWRESGASLLLATHDNRVVSAIASQAPGTPSLTLRPANEQPGQALSPASPQEPR